MQKQHSQRLSLIVNIVIPMIILTKFSGESALGTSRWLVAALAFPLGYGLREWKQEGSRSFVSWLWLFSVLMTWGIGLLELPTEWVAIKEAMVPGIIWLVLLGSLYTWHNLVEKMFSWILHTEKIFHTLENKMHHRHAWMRKLTRWMIGSFALSTFLNYVLASRIVTSPAGTEAFNQEIWRLTWLSFPAIALPATLVMTIAMVVFLMNLSKVTWLEIEEMIQQQ
jgi:hypothetical protein